MPLTIIHMFVVELVGFLRIHTNFDGIPLYNRFELCNYFAYQFNFCSSSSDRLSFGSKILCARKTPSRKDSYDRAHCANPTSEARMFLCPIEYRLEIRRKFTSHSH